MQLLIVHDDAEVGEQLAGMVADYTSHRCDLVENDAAALRWAETHAHCDLLLAQLEGTGIDGLTLGGSLSEVFAGLQVLFLPAYPAAQRCLDIARTKVFPEPIDGERLLEAIESAASARETEADLFHVLDVLQMCCLRKRTGAVQVVKGEQSGIVYLRDGKIVHAEGAITRGREALLEIAGWDNIEFAYDSEARAPETISMSWDEALVQTLERSKGEKQAEAKSAPPKTAPEPAEPPRPRKRGFFAGLLRS
jgi:DNA-binding response OmpR family regulator